MRTLVIVEYSQNQIQSSTLSTIKAAHELRSEIDLMVCAEPGSTIAAEAAKLPGVVRVVSCESSRFSHLLAEDVAEAVAQVAADYSHILVPATSFGKDVLPRAAALLDVGQISDVTAINAANRFIRPMYAGNILAEVETQETKILLSIRPTAFMPISGASPSPAVIESKTITLPEPKSYFVSQEKAETLRPMLAGARVVVAGGRGLQSKENFAMLEALADELGAALGASRAAVDAGYIANEYQVGQTGQVVAPELYIAVGISGAIQHLAGMKESKVIVAINKDPDAPIFQLADYAMIGDLFQIIPELTAALKARKAKA